MFLYFVLYLHTAYVLYHCNMVGWTWWDLSLILRTLFSFSALSLLIVPVVTYTVFGVTLNPTQSINPLMSI